MTFRDVPFTIRGEVDRRVACHISSFATFTISDRPMCGWAKGQLFLKKVDWLSIDAQRCAIEIVIDRLPICYHYFRRMGNEVFSVGDWTHVEELTG